VENERAKVDIRETGDWFSETLEVPKNSRFSSTKRSSSSTYSEGIGIADTSRMNNISKLFFKKLLFIFTPRHLAQVSGG
jgi:hypothetical protein